MDRDLRRFRRIASQNAVLVKGVGKGAIVEELAATKTLGPGGCGFLSDESLGVGSILELLISVRHEVIKTKGRVVYEVAEDHGKCEVGVQFLDLSPEDRDRIELLFESDEDE